MVFSSITFLGIFLPIFLIAYFLIPKRGYRNAMIIVFSLFFYAWGEPIWILGMIGLTFVDYILALLEAKIKNEKARKLYLFGVVVINLLMLFFFKYYNFFVGNINDFLGLNIPLHELRMPIGISFFTFQALTYVVDVHRKNVEPQKNYFNLLLYISMFPQLIAGPIVRYADVEKQITNRKETIDGFNYGMLRFAIGLAKKVIFANYAGLIAKSFLGANHISKVSTAGAWFGMIMFLCQLYYDFSGYSDMAIGLGKILGFTYKENFNYPYIAKNVNDLWKRWHISLGEFFRDYVYIPLGGNRKHQYFNISVVWLLTGLWHGANWNYVLWGVFFVIILISEKLLKKINVDIGNIPVLGNLGLLLIVFVGWSLFYFEDLSILKQFFLACVGLTNNIAMGIRESTPIYQYFFLICVMLPGCTPLPKLIATKIFPEGTTRRVFMGSIFSCALLFVCFCLLLRQSYNPFMYFRF